ncbi:VOC family protein [Rathayibacter sp. YIM 133350]|uniref:VOC family protein n=1 Tax=Rathayibacter sp. YIM 133350 TaxID=3131992 RepID=UPI00307F6E70
MITPVDIFSGFAVRDVDAARSFYADVLGLNVEDAMGGISLGIGGGKRVFVYVKPDHEPATYTVLNFAVDDIDAAVAELERSGVSLLHYDGFGQDEHGIARPPAGSGGGPDIAWFTDPSGNILSVLQPPAE